MKGSETGTFQRSVVGEIPNEVITLLCVRVSIVHGLLLQSYN